MQEYIITTALSLAITIIIFVSLFIQRKSKTKTTGLFLVLTISVTAYLIINFLAEILDGNPNLIGLLYVLNLLTFLCMDIILIAFLEYLCSFMGTLDDREKTEKIVVKFTCAFRIIITIMLLFSGNLFTMDENGCYVEGNFTFIPYVASMIAMLELLVLVIVNRKHFTKRQFIVVIIYVLFPVVPIALEYIFSEYALMGPVLVLSLLMIYLLMQDTAIVQSQLRETIFEELSNLDVLSGIQNRRAFYDKSRKYQGDEVIGVIFCDINGLKYTNDNFGHGAGDELIVKFTGVLMNSLGKENIYRISGDEFVGIVETDSYEHFIEAINRLHNNIVLNNNIAAMGVAYGKASRFEELVNEAEAKMYDDKQKNGHRR